MTRMSVEAPEGTAKRCAAEPAQGNPPSTEGADLVFAALTERVPRTSAPAKEFLNTAWSRMTADAIELAERLRRAQCGLGGHSMVLHFEPDKMSLRCLSCGEETPGWTIRPVRVSGADRHV